MSKGNPQFPVLRPKHKISNHSTGDLDLISTDVALNGSPNNNQNMGHQDDSHLLYFLNFNKVKSVGRSESRDSNHIQTNHSKSY